MSEVYLVQKELYHHGIKGMKWGVRRFQKKDGSLTPAGKKRYADGDGEKRKGLSDKQKKAIKVGTAAVVTGLAIYGSYKLSQMYKGAGQDIDPETGFRLLKDGADRSDISTINPGRVKLFTTKYKNKEIINGSSTNCMLCTTTYELRKRGYDVHAGFEKTGTGWMPDALFPHIYKDYKGTTKILGVNQDMAFNNIVSHAKNEGPGSRGNIMVWWKQGGGHSMIWENVDGNIVFKDGQTNQIYKNFKNDVLKNMHTAKPVEMLRTDNLELNIEDLKRGGKQFINPDTILKTYVDHGGEIAVKMANDPTVQIVGGSAALGTYYRINRNKAINNYRKQHPNSKMTDKEIAKMLARQY